MSIIAHVYAHTHIYTHISVSQTGNTHQFLPFESNNPEFILALHFSISSFPFSNNEKPGPYYSQHINLFTRFPHMTLMSWSQRPSQLWSTGPASWTC